MAMLSCLGDLCLARNGTIEKWAQTQKEEAAVSSQRYHHGCHILRISNCRPLLCADSLPHVLRLHSMFQLPVDTARHGQGLCIQMLQYLHQNIFGVLRRDCDESMWSGFQKLFHTNDKKTESGSTGKRNLVWQDEFNRVRCVRTELQGNGIWSKARYWQWQ